MYYKLVHVFDCLVYTSVALDKCCSHASDRLHLEANVRLSSSQMFRFDRLFVGGMYL